MLNQNEPNVIHDVNVKTFNDSDLVNPIVLQDTTHCSTVLEEKQPQFKGFSTDKVIRGLNDIPAYCALTPVNEKKPYRKNWNKEQPVSRKTIINDIKSGQATGFGLRTGEISNGSLAIDVDGFSAEEKLQELSKGDLPKTWAWTSGKPSRRQIVYKAKPEHWHLLRNLPIPTDRDKGEQLDFRWNGKQSVLPPSKHPETGEYKWINSPSNTEIADCPGWVINMMLEASTKEEKVKEENRPRPEPKVLPFRLANDTHFDYPSLFIYLTNDDKNLILAGASQGGRNEAAKKLSINLVATEREVQRLGYTCHDTALDLYETFRSRCTPPLEDSEADKWFIGAESKAHLYSPSNDIYVIQNCYKAWTKRKYGIWQESVEKAVSLIHKENYEPKTQTVLKPQTEFEHRIELRQYLSAKSKAILENKCQAEDKIYELTKFIKDAVGWENWLNERNIGTSDNSPELIQEAGLLLGIDNNRIIKILDSIDTFNCKPALWYHIGDVGCWDRIKATDKKIFEKVCPELDIVKTQEFKSDLNLEKFKKSRKLANSIKQNSLPLDLIIAIKLIELLEEGGYLIAIKSAMGSGKTYGLIQVLLKLYEQDPIGFFFLAHRIKLIHQVCSKSNKAGIPSTLLNEADIKDSHGQSLVADLYHSIFLCGESLHKVEKYMSGRNMIVDEVCSVMAQLNSGGTVSGAKQAKALKAFESAAKKCKNLIIMDANLSQIEVDLAANLSGKKVTIIENIAKPEPSVFYFVTPVESDDEDDETGEEELDSKKRSAIVIPILESKKPFIVSDSSAFLHKALEPEFIKKKKLGFILCQEYSVETWTELEQRIPGTITRFKPKDVKKKWADELLTDPDEFINKYKPDYLGISPTGESGLSIEIKGYFTQRFLVSAGVVSLNSLSQMPFRLRDNSIPTYVLMPDCAIPEDERDYYLGAEELRREQRFERHKLISQAYSENDDETAQKLKVAEFAHNRLSEFWDEYARQLAERGRLERSNYKKFFKVLLAEMGHKVVDIELESSKKLDLKLIKNKEASLIDNATKIYHSPDVLYEIADKEYQKNPTVTNALIKSKASIVHFLPGINETEIWGVEFILETLKNRKYRTGKDYYFLLKNPEIFKTWVEYNQYQKNTNEFVSVHSLGNKKAEVVTGLTRIGFIELLDYLEQGNEVTKDSEIIKTTLEKGRLKDNKLLIGIVPGKTSVTGQERIRYIQDLLALVGLKLDETGQKLDTDGIKKRFYKIKEERLQCAMRLAILDSLKTYYDNWLNQKYKKPEWAFSANNEGVKHPKFEEERINTSDEFRHYGNSNDDKQSDRTNADTVKFLVNGEEIEYKLPGLDVIKVAGLYYRIREGETGIREDFGTPESLVLGLELLSAMDEHEVLKETVLRWYPWDFGQWSLD